MNDLNADLYPRDAELALLTAAFHDPTVTKTVPVDPTDFYQPAHEQIWRAIAALHADGIRPDGSTLLARLTEANARSTIITDTLLDIASPTGWAVIPANAAHYAETVTDWSARRRLLADCDHIKALAVTLAAPIADTIAEAERRIVGGGSAERDTEGVVTLEEFLAGDDERQDWILPGLLARGDRLVLTGVEGMGKTTIARQIGIMLASGLDPFTLHPIPAKRVLYVDCENPKRIMRDKMRDLQRVAAARQRNPEDRLWIQRYPQGLDLAKGSDRLKLHHLCALLNPDLLLIGPAYKLYVGGASDREETLAREVTAALDGLRERFGFALVLEHHSPHAQPGQAQRTVRPIGSSLWLRWPEFGYGIRPQKGTTLEQRKAEWSSWRGARDERPWPKTLEAGQVGELPWVDPARTVRR